MVFCVLFGIVKVVPVASMFVSVKLEYQFIIPASVVAWSVTGPGPHLDTGVFVDVTVGMVFIVAVIGVLAVEQPAST